MIHEDIDGNLRALCPYCERDMILHNLVRDGHLRFFVHKGRNENKDRNKNNALCPGTGRMVVNYQKLLA